jgi:Predicted EndoIII-related endonuclease
MSEYVPLFQENLVDDLKDGQFWMLVACSLVNLTHWRQAKPVFEELRETCDGWSWNLARIPLDVLVDVLRPLGMQNRRARTLHQLSVEWQNMLAEKVEAEDSHVTRRDVERLPGCGRYAADSWAIFVEKDLTVVPNDGRLNEYLDHVKEKVDD